MSNDFRSLKYSGSFSDPRLAFIRGLSKKKTAEESGCFFIEGERAVSEVPSGPGNVKTVVVSRNFIDGIDENPGRYSMLSALKKSGAEFVGVTDKVFASLSGTVTPQGIGAVIRRPDNIPPGSLPETFTRVLVLENIQDPGNVGTCIRTADAFGFNAVICVDNCADVYNPKVLRSTVGSLFHLTVIQYAGGIFKLCGVLKSKGFTVFGADPRGGIGSDSPEFYACKAAVIIGNEANGLSDSARAVSDRLVSIHMGGSAESLNAAVAASVLMYELTHRASESRN